MYKVILYNTFTGGMKGRKRKIWQFKKEIELPFPPFYDLSLSLESEGGKESITILKHDSDILWVVDDDDNGHFTVELQEHEYNMENAISLAKFKEEHGDWELIHVREVEP